MWKLRPTIREPVNGVALRPGKIGNVLAIIDLVLMQKKTDFAHWLWQTTQNNFSNFAWIKFLSGFAKINETTLKKYLRKILQISRWCEIHYEQDLFSIILVDQSRDLEISQLVISSYDIFLTKQRWSKSVYQIIGTVTQKLFIMLQNVDLPKNPWAHVYANLLSRKQIQLLSHGKYFVFCFCSFRSFHLICFGL